MSNEAYGEARSGDGWVHPEGARKWHYRRAGTSLSGRWGWFWPKHGTPARKVDECRACRAVLEREGGLAADDAGMAAILKAEAEAWAARSEDAALRSKEAEELSRGW